MVFLASYPSYPPTPHTPPLTNSPTTSPPSSQRKMDNDIKQPIFKGTRSEDPKKFWFLCEAIWTMKQVHDENMNKAQLFRTFWDKVITWYLKYSSNQNIPFADIKTTLVKEFKKMKSELQCITQIKEILKKMPTESIWEFDQRFKILLDQVRFEIALQQHKVWFIVVLLPHIILPLSQQNIETQAESLELMMKLDDSSIGDTNVGM